MEGPENVKLSNGVEVKLRPMIPDDQPFLYSSWLQSFRASKVNAGLRGSVYYKRQGLKITNILERGTTRVIVACDVNDNDHIYGYIVFELRSDSTVLHYIYVKETFRRLGVAAVMIQTLKRLIGTYGAPFFYSHFPANEDIHGVAKKLGIEYDPETAS